MVVPHRDEWPAGACILQIGVVQVGLVDRPVILDCCRNVQVIDLFAMGIPDDVAYAPVVHPLRAIFRIPDDLRK